MNTGKMELNWTIEGNKGYVYLKYSGDPDFKTWSETMIDIFKHPEYKSGFGFLADLTESGIPDTNHLRAVKEFIIDHKSEMANSKWANIVTQRPAHYGMTRVAQVFVEDLPVQINAFLTEREALEWLINPSI
jgi:hypothetical protein